MALFSYSLILLALSLLESINLKPTAGVCFVLMALFLAVDFFSLFEVVLLGAFSLPLLYFLGAGKVFAFGQVSSLALVVFLYSLFDFKDKILASAPLGIALFYLLLSFSYRIFSLGNFSWFFLKNFAVFLIMFYVLKSCFKTEKKKKYLGFAKIS